MTMNYIYKKFKNIHSMYVIFLTPTFSRKVELEKRKNSKEKKSTYFLKTRFYIKVISSVIFKKLLF